MTYVSYSTFIVSHAVFSGNRIVFVKTFMLTRKNITNATFSINVKRDCSKINEKRHTTAKIYNNMTDKTKTNDLK